MKVILLEKIKNIGDKYTVVNVAPGYGRNFLFKKGLAQLATSKNLAELETKQRIEEKKNVYKQEEIKDLADKISGEKIVIKKKVNKEGKLFGSVTEKDIIKALLGRGINLGDGKVMFEQPIKELGEYKIKISFSHQFESEFTIIIKEE